MIVRIVGEGQFELADEVAARLNALDTALLTELNANREAGFADVLARMLQVVRTEGRALPLDEFAESDAILPPADASAAGVRETIGDMGLIPD